MKIQPEIDFSAFPSRGSGIQPWQLALTTVIVTTTLLVISAIIEQSTHSGNGIAIMQITVIIVILILFITLVVIVFQFIFGVIIPRLIRIVRNEPQTLSPADDYISIMRRFSIDNAFQFTEYPFETQALDESYNGVASKRQGDDIFILYQVTGTFSNIHFAYYCLGVAKAEKYMGNIDDRGFGYAYTSDGRRVNYMTVLATDHPIQPWYKGQINAINNPNGRVFCNGYVTDRKTAQKMFAILKEPERSA